MLRRFFFLVFFPPWTFLISSLSWLLAGVGKNAIVSHRLEIIWAKAALALAGVKVQADLSALDPAGHYVFLANHQSHFDILIFFAALDGYNVRFLAKRELFRIPVFGPAMRRIGHLPVNRENRRQAMQGIEDAAKAAARGLCVLIFPEGTRNLDPTRLMEFKTGGMIMALKCALPVAPLVLRGSFAVLPKGALAPRPASVVIKALPPFDPTQHYTLKQRDAFRIDLYNQMSKAYSELSA